jgi:hypothetical protein
VTHTAMIRADDRSTAVTGGSSGEGLTFAALRRAPVQGGEPARAGAPLK